MARDGFCKGASSLHRGVRGNPPARPSASVAGRLMDGGVPEHLLRPRPDLLRDRRQPGILSHQQPRLLAKQPHHPPALAGELVLATANVDQRHASEPREGAAMERPAPAGPAGPSRPGIPRRSSPSRRRRRCRPFVTTASPSKTVGVSPERSWVSPARPVSRTEIPERAFSSAGAGRDRAVRRARTVGAVCIEPSSGFTERGTNIRGASPDIHPPCRPGCLNNWRQPDDAQHRARNPRSRPWVVPRGGFGDPRGRVGRGLGARAGSFGCRSAAARHHGFRTSGKPGS